ncbi:MAG: flavodoxin family protein, partial [Deltaproteobacteria bacterium]|nr:flavodoxin family protein [Deltaproteobacteria bacterium]
MRVVAINGSPRKGGNTTLLVQTVCQELEAEGIATEIIQVGHKAIPGCLACRKCWETKDGTCIQKDGVLNEALERMREADGLIFGSPVYFADMAGPLKCFMDRAFMVARANGGWFRRKPGACVAAARRAGSVHTINSMNHYLGISEMLTVGSSYWNMGFGLDKGAVSEDQEGMQT